MNWHEAATGGWESGCGRFIIEQSPEGYSLLAWSPEDGDHTGDSAAWDTLEEAQAEAEELAAFTVLSNLVNAGLRAARQSQ